MENAPLGQAYDHAKNAIIYRDNGSLNAARESHEQAAGSFATAAHSTEDFEAIRLLSLLQEHHKQLSRALASSSKHPKATQPQESDEKEPVLIAKAKEDVSTSRQSKDKTAGHSDAKNPALATLTARKARRDLNASTINSSLANNLATARGRPTSQRKNSPLPPDVTAQHAGGKLVTQGAGRTSLESRPSTLRRTSAVPSVTETPPTDTFSTFYNSLQGLYAKLPASLAFAGLPLTIEEGSVSQASPNQVEDAKNHRRQRSSRATADPDYSTIFSPSTIKALQDDHRGSFAGHESFYVVPTSGGTKSYANIASGRQEDGLLGGDDDAEEFMDARESMGPPSPKLARSSGTLRQKARQIEPPRAPGGKNFEELELENHALRQLLDTQSKRLAIWETSAQSQSMRLAQSMRVGRHDESADRLPAGTESERVKELEDEIISERAQRQSVERHNAKLEREKEKLLAALGKYKDKWAMLTEKARQRERNKQANVAANQDPE